ncbi:MAG: patatin-like phospholipase family protein [Deltaproteobacteria bacterium]|nr:patatin-like phospholipase family protein [Deltaproteobacteria bacterium]MBW2213470.1 patatin-like phospholipase family protein [Deltaproteobacteria bacterium]MBW2378363.1 patatin-like phospholipase family protein [Deltaproteobacteria bacterium]MBW2549482.1 patatin-like phospholipase family protein [Deltaproteobacteria bacterium]MBW2627546.1 patatin-like phospholipase family protein [Deltaproteobacteria bacterium]
MSGLGLILSGGGARGAYEVGVLEYVFSEFADARGNAPKIDLISGTSVGAVNGAFVASAIGEMPGALKQLVSLWADLELPHVLGFGLRQAAGLYRVLLGGSAQARGVFDPTPLSAIVGRAVHWRRLRRNIRSGALRALTVSTTHVGTGQPVIFVDAAPGVGIPKGLGLHALVRQAKIGQHHVLASAAIPLIFPPVEIGDEIHCDGGLRLNTPIGPSIHLGMNRLLVVGLSTPHAADRRAVQDGKFPGATYMLGKVLNAFLLDHVNTDLLDVQRINDFLHDGIRAYGPEFIERINEAAKLRGALAERRLLNSLVLRPTTDIGQVASDYLASNRVRFGKSLGRAFISMLDVGAGADADLASYLLFDGGFAQTLIEMGRRDAHEKRDEIEAFLFEDPNAILFPANAVDSAQHSESKPPE